MDTESINISNIPATQRTQVGYRTGTNSAQMNQSQNEILQDVLDLFNKANRMEKAIDETRSVVGAENTYLQYRVNDLEAKIATLSQRYRDLSGNSGAHKLIVRYPNEMTVDGSDHAALIDLESMSVTMQPSRISSKVNLYDEGLQATFVPPSLSLALSPAATILGQGVLSITESDPINAFNGDAGTYWARRVLTDETVNEVTVDLTIGLPEDIITTRETNTITLNPYPVNAVDVLAVEYRKEGAWTSVPGFEDHRASLIEEYTDIYGTAYERPVMKDAANLKLCFRGIDANQLRIRLRQRHFLSAEAGKREFHLGIKGMRVSQNTYAKEYSTFQTDIVFPEENGSIIVHGADAVLNNPSELSDRSVQCEYYYYGSDEMPHKVPETVPFTLTGKRMLVKFHLYGTEVTPNVSRVQVGYTIV